MQFITFSVRFILTLIIANLLCSFTTNSSVPPIPTPAASALAGKWDCGSKSGHLDEYTSYQLNCGGDVVFKSDFTVESTVTDAFLPTGSKWQVENDKLVLRDSYGAIFIDFEIKKLEGNQLVLSRKGIDYGFVRVI